MSESGYYAAWLRLDGCRCVVVGGGRVAERKIGRLLQSGAKALEELGRDRDGHGDGHGHGV